jgi:hypothetical protein
MHLFFLILHSNCSYTKMKKLRVIVFAILLASLLSCKKDSNAPVITILGKNPVETGWGYAYTDAGATATDKEDGDLTSKIIVSSNVDTAAIGTYYVRYNVTDSDGNKAKEVQREVKVSYFKK